MRTLKNLNSDNLLFIDIETVRYEKQLTTESKLFDAWKYRMRKEDSMTDETLIELFEKNAALYIPFGKTVCISIGKIVKTESGEEVIKMHSIYGKDEKELLLQFNSLIEKLYNKNKNLVFCGFYSNSFDIPFLFKRMIIHGIEAHELIDTSGLKPWEMKNLDLSEQWKGNSFYPDSLVAITAILDIESPKQDINGSQTSDVYYGEENGCLRIARYCENDVKATINVYRRFRFEEIIKKVESKIAE